MSFNVACTDHYALNPPEDVQLDFQREVQPFDIIVITYPTSGIRIFFLLLPHLQRNDQDEFVCNLKVQSADVNLYTGKMAGALPIIWGNGDADMLEDVEELLRAWML